MKVVSVHFFKFSTKNIFTQHFFLEILRTKHGVWHMWIWYLGEPEEAGQFRCEIAIRKRAREDEAEIRYADVRVEMEQANLNYLITTTQIMKSMEPATTKLLTSVKPKGAPRG